MGCLGMGKHQLLSIADMLMPRTGCLTTTASE